MSFSDLVNVPAIIMACKNFEIADHTEVSSDPELCNPVIAYLCGRESPPPDFDEPPNAAFQHTMQTENQQDGFKSDFPSELGSSGSQKALAAADNGDQNLLDQRAQVAAAPETSIAQPSLHSAEILGLRSEAAGRGQPHPTDTVRSIDQNHPPAKRRELYVPLSSAFRADQTQGPPGLQQRLAGAAASDTSHRRNAGRAVSEPLSEAASRAVLAETAGAAAPTAHARAAPRRRAVVKRPPKPLGAYWISLPTGRKYAIVRAPSGTAAAAARADATRPGSSGERADELRVDPQLLAQYRLIPRGAGASAARGSTRSVPASSSRRWRKMNSPVHAARAIAA